MSTTKIKEILLFSDKKEMYMKKRGRIDTIGKKGQVRLKSSNKKQQQRGS